MCGCCPLFVLMTFCRVRAVGHPKQAVPLILRMGGIEMKVEIGNAKEFMGKQMSKVQQRAEEEKQIKKGIYQMKAMIAFQSMETLMEESDKAKERTGIEQKETESTTSKTKESRKTDAKTEMEKMISAAGRSASLNKVVV